MVRIRTALSDEPLIVEDVISGTGGPDCGATAVFVGTVRETPAISSPGRRVIRLEYEAHRALAEQRLQSIADTAARRWDLRAIVAVHRLGACRLTEPTVVIACGAPHRKEALEACQWAIDEIKATVPIWKREVYDVLPHHGEVWWFANVPRPG